MWKLRLRVSLSNLLKITQGGNDWQGFECWSPVLLDTWGSPKSAFGEGNRVGGLTVASQLEFLCLFQGPDAGLVPQGLAEP